MKKIRISQIITLMLLLLSPLAVAQDYTDRITVSGEQFSRTSSTTTVGLNFGFDNLDIKSNHLLIVTPVLTAADGSESVELPSMAVVGKRRNTILNRPFNWKDKPEITAKGQYTLVSTRKLDPTIAYKEAIPYAAWHKDASLSIKTDVSGCAECLTSGALPLFPRLFPELYQPTYKVSMITPEVEAVKERSETHQAFFNYHQGRYNLLPNFENNAAELAKVHKVIVEVQGDSDLTFTDIKINGYASPEGNFNSNITLSKNRANTFKQYLVNKYGMKENEIDMEAHGEDWDGLRKVVEASSMEFKKEVLEIIDTEPNHDARDMKLINLDQGKTYNYMLTQLYPPLRRNDYTVGFIARAFDVEEAKQMLKTRPHLLSLNEMFLVAETYEAGSAAYNEVFEIAARTFPNDIISNINVAAIDLQNGNADAAYDRLTKLQDNPKVWNNLAIAMAMKGMYEEADALLQRAVAQNDKDAGANAEELKKMIETM